MYRGRLRQQGCPDARRATQAADSSRLMGTIDALNGWYGRSTVALASAGLAGDKRRWVMKQECKTPDYPTRWADLPTARA